MDAKTMTMNSLTTQDKAKSMMGRISRDNIVLFGLLAGLSTMMILFILMPLWAMLAKSVQNSDGEFVGLANFATYFSSSSLWVSVGNTFSLGLVVTTVVGILAFGYAYALTRSCMPFKGLFHILGTAPILAPSLLPAISLIFLFGNQGVAKELLGGHSVYGVIGISMGLIFWTFPHALMILTTSLRTSDARLYEAARALKTSPMKTFFYGDVTCGEIRFDQHSDCRIHVGDHRFWCAESHWRKLQRSGDRHLQTSGGPAKLCHGCSNQHHAVISCGNGVWCGSLGAEKTKELV